MGRSGVDRASSSDALGPGFEPRPLRFKKIPLLYPETLEVPIRGRVQLWILELGDEAGEEQKKKKCKKSLHKNVLVKWLDLEIEQMVQDIRCLEESMGGTLKAVQPCEIPTIEKLGKSLVFAR